MIISSLPLLASASPSVALNHFHQKCRFWGPLGLSQSTYLGAEPVKDLVVIWIENILKAREFKLIVKIEVHKLKISL